MIPCITHFSYLDKIVFGCQPFKSLNPLNRILLFFVKIVTVAFFFKQWGGRTPKAGGRILDGKEWNEFPLTKKRNSHLVQIVPIERKAK
jgi:hypothetical protein